MTDLLVIKIVAEIEFTIKKLVCELIDTYNLNTSNLFEKPVLEIPISTLNAPEYKELTRGKIVSTNFNFQNKKVINFVLNELLNVDDFLSELKKAISTYEFGSSDTRKMVIENWDDFLKIFELRNNIAHKSDNTNEYDENTNHFFGLSSLMFISVGVNLAHKIIQQNKKK